MGHSTDLKPAGGSTAAGPDVVADAYEVLRQIADHFTDVRPTRPLDPDALLVCASTSAYDLCGRSTGARTAQIEQAALALAPPRPDTITRGEYALQLRRTIDAQTATQTATQPAAQAGADGGEAR